MTGGLVNDNIDDNDAIYFSDRLFCNDCTESVIDNNSQPFNCISNVVFPRFYLLNATSLAKPNAKQHLTADINNFKSDMVLIVETWLTSKHSSADLEINGFSLYRRDRHGKRKGGGLCIYASNKYSCTIININYVSEPNPNIELLWLLCNTDHCNFAVCLCYHPPKPQYKCSDFIDCLIQGADFIAARYNTDFTTIAGDFNSLNTDFLSVDLGFIQIVKESTHINKIIDKVFISRPGIYNHCFTIRSIVKTKHRAVVFTTQNDIYSHQPSCKRKFFVYDKRQHNIDRLRFYLGTFNWSYLFDFDSIDSLYSEFVRILNEAITTCIPTKTVTIRSTEPYYITPFIKSLLVRRNKLRRKGRINEADELASKINDLIRQTQLDRLSKLSTSNTAELWKFVRTKQGNASMNLSSNNLLSSPDDVNDFFAQISTDINYNISDVLSACDASPCNNNSDVNKFEMLQPYTIENLLSRLKHTSPGFDGIPSWFFKFCSVEISEIITYIINKSLSVGTIPHIWRTAIVTPIQKNPNPHTLSDFRPISVTSILSRITEKLIVNNWLRPALPTPSLLDQFAFKQTGSTACALSKVTDTITLSFENDNDYVTGLMVDFSKAFDTVDHAILVTKLNRLEMPFCIKNWIVSFLINRSQIVKINGEYSSPVNINRGIVQGSALGPYLFLLMIADLKPLSSDNNYIKYADDLTVLVPEHSPIAADMERQHIIVWARDNKLFINVQKTFEFMFFRNDRASINFYDCNPDIAKINNCRLLGVHLDRKLNFNEHVNSLLTTCSQRFYILRVLRGQGFPLNALHVIYNSIIINKILYCLPVWGGFVKAHDVERFNALFRRAKKYGYTHTIYDFNGLLFTADLKLFNNMQSPLHCLNHILPPVKNSIIQSLRPRGHVFNLPVTRNEFRKKSFLVRALYTFI